MATILPNFSSILDGVNDEDIEAPVPLPPGHYMAVVMGQPRWDKSTRKQTDFVEYALRLTEAGQDVNEDDLAEQGGLEDRDRILRLTFYLVKDDNGKVNPWRLKQFLNDCGVEPGGDMTERASKAENCFVKVLVKHELSQDGKTTYANIARTMPAD